MNEEQINEVMRLADELADACAGCDSSHFALGQRAALEAYLRTIGEPAGYSLPAGSMGEKKWAQLPKDCKPIGLVFQRIDAKTGAITEAGRVTWADWLAYPEADEPESVNAELLEALKDARHCIGIDRDTLVDCHTNPCTGYLDPDGALAKAEYDDVIDAADAAIARAESAIETPAKVSPCAGHATQQDADLRQIVGIKEAVAGIAEFFEGEYHSGITGIVDASKVRGEREEDECRPEFDHCYVTQGGGGFDGDDFHGTVYFHIGNGEYATVDY